MAYNVQGQTVIDSDKNIIAGTPSLQASSIVVGAAFVLPSGTTLERPANPIPGSMFFDTDLGTLVTYNGTDWA